MIQLGSEARLPVEEHVLDRMTDAMTHRGPDDRGTHLAPGVAFGARRLSIVDLALGHQPFANEDGTVWGMQNGELYNHESVRRDLERDGHRFTSRCDTEILPHLYERHGTDFVQRLRGKYGLAVWDARRRRAVVARDRLGVKPMYYAVVGDLVVFGSELKSVLASGLVPTDLDLEAIDAYLTFGFVPAPRTPLAAVRKLMPGEQLVVDGSAVRLEQYWSFPEPDPEPLRNVDEHAEELLAVLEESVRLRLMADVPLGVMLSGGLDSSLIVALTARHATEAVKTFSVGFLEAGGDNELADAREVASLYGAEHHELELSFAEQQVDLADLMWHMDEPVADLSALGFIALSKLAAETVTVALSGQGADELLGGYSRHRNARVASWLWRAPAPVRSALVAAARLGPRQLQSVAGIAGGSDAVARQVAAFAAIRNAALRGGGLRADADSAPAEAVRARLNGLRSNDPLATMLFLDGQLGLVDDMLHYFDRASMAHSLEVRVPFLDHVVVEHCARIPPHLKVRGLTTKWLLKRAARGIVPDRIIDKRKIGFFSGAVDAWFRAQATGVIPQYLLAEDARYGDLLDRREIERMVGSFAGGEGDGRQLLPALMLEIWLSEFLPRAAATAAPARERIEVPT